VTEATPTPKFRRPPVIETILGVQFAPLERFSIPHFGLFWASIRDKYPRQEMKPPLGPEIEEFGGQLGPPTLNLLLTAEPDARCWFIDSSGTQLIQVQRDRFIRNWRKVSGGDEYPSYDVLKPRFREDWARFHDFLAREELGRPEINQCEVTYVNHIAQWEGWSSFGETHKVISLLASPIQGFLPEPEIVALNNRYLMTDKKGRLHVTLQPAVRRGDGKVVLQLTLTARGRPASSRSEDIISWFDMGHEWIVRGFVDITTTDMHRLWERLP
jgi:uncharacterized protein (TIGR04255 family)